MSAKTPSPDRLHFERELWGQGVAPIAGVDEAGRGPLAGPVVVAAVVLPESWAAAGVPEHFLGLNDSKKLSGTVRDRYFDLLLADPTIHHAIISISHTEIDRLNILAATHSGMNQALKALPCRPSHALVDGTRVPSLSFLQSALVKGDSRSYSIAAASILAKVTRDRIMVDAEQLYPGYGFATHKGYPTPDHLDAIRRLGPCPIHRRSFAPIRQPDPELFS